MLEPIKIVVADCYHDSDKGGGGMVAGVIAAVTEACARHGRSVELSLLFRFSEDDPRFTTAARHTRNAYPDLSILPAPVSSRRGPGYHWLSWSLRVIFLGGFRMLWPRLSRHPALQSISDADHIVFKGGNFYRSWSSNSISDLFALLLQFYTSILAWRMSKTHSFCSHTFGPFNTATSRKVVKWILTNASYVSARERISKEVLVNCGISPDRISVDPDFAFGAPLYSPKCADEILRSYKLEPGEFIAFTARPWFYDQMKQDDGSKFQEYISSAAKLLDYAMECGLTKVALVVQNDGAHSRKEPDAPILMSIKDRMIHRHHAVIVDDDFAFDELCAIYKNARLTLGTRLHSCIFSFSVGTPTIAIAYSHKAKGIMTMMGLNRYILDINSLNVEHGKSLIDDLLANRNELVSAIHLRRDTLLRRLVKATETAIFEHSNLQM